MPRGPNVLLSLSERGPLYGFCAYAKPTELIFSRQSRLTTPTRGVLSQRCQHTQSPPRCRYPARTFRRRFSQNPTKNSTASGFQTSTHAHEKSEAPAPLRPIVLTPIENALKTLFIDVAQSIRGRKLREGASGADIPKLELRFVGGWVRDKLRGRDTEDIDLGIAGMNSYDFCYAVRDYLSDPQRWEKYQAMIPSPKFQPGPVGVHRMRGNVRNTNYAGACLSNIFGLYVDIVSFQKPTGPGRPISPLDALKMDAFRLDATINTLHYNLTTSEVEDLTGKGLRDLRHGVIRTPLSPYDTLAYDPIRILRLIRFASEPRYHIERNTKHGMRNGLILMSFKTDPMPRRVTVELNKILRGSHQKKALELIDELRLYRVLFTSNHFDFTPDISKWKAAYQSLEQLSSPGPLNDWGSKRIFDHVRACLIRNPHDMYYAWLACTFAPWMSVPTQAVPRKKPLSPWAVEIARERLWLTLPNLIVLGDVVSHFRGVIQAKSAFLGKGMGKTDAESQEQVKKDFASWGPNWRTCMVMAILHECMEGGDLTEVLQQYYEFLRVYMD